MFQTSEKSPLFNRSYYSLFRIQKEKKKLFGTNLPKRKIFLKNMDEKTSSSVVLKFGTIKLKSQYTHFAILLLL